MTWKEKLRQASFRGIEFYVSSSDVEGGRRIAKHEFPQKDIPFVEDLGKKAKSFPIEAYVLGDDYMERRDLLIDALDKEGPGLLVHPYYGELNLQVSDWKVKETKDEGGIATFAITFEQTGEINYPVSFENNTNILNTKADKLDESLAQNMNKNFKTNILSSYKKAVGFIKDTTKSLENFMSPIASLVNIAEEVSKGINDIATEAMALARSPLTLAYNLQNAIKRIQNIPEYAKDIMKAYSLLNKTFFEYFDEIDETEEPETKAENLNKTNAKSMKQLLCLTIAGAMARTANNMNFTTYDDAENTKNLITEIIDEIIATTDDDDIFKDAVDLKIALSKILPPENQILKNIVLYELKDTLPSIVLCYDIYANLDNEQDILDRNKIENPAMMIGGKEVEVVV
jgi:prophage DNA circulation protein